MLMINHKSRIKESGQKRCRLCDFFLVILS